LIPEDAKIVIQPHKLDPGFDKVNIVKAKIDGVKYGNNNKHHDNYNWGKYVKILRQGSSGAGR
ncbi:unnamed protein product, partial [marine sediment metagenome]